MMASIVRSHVMLIALVLVTSAAIAEPENKNTSRERPSDIDFTAGDDSMVLEAGIPIGRKNAYMTAGATYHRDDGLAGWLGWQIQN